MPPSTAEERDLWLALRARMSWLSPIELERTGAEAQPAGPLWDAVVDEANFRLHTLAEEHLSATDAPAVRRALTGLADRDVLPQHFLTHASMHITLLRYTEEEFGPRSLTHRLGLSSMRVHPEGAARYEFDQTTGDHATLRWRGLQRSDPEDTHQEDGRCCDEFKAAHLERRAGLRARLMLFGLAERSVLPQDLDRFHTLLVHSAPDWIADPLGRNLGIDRHAVLPLDKDAPC